MNITESFKDAEEFSENVTLMSNVFFTENNPVYLFSNDNPKMMPKKWILKI